MREGTDLDTIAELARALPAARVEAREGAIRLLRELERRLQQALGGSQLRGLPRLLPPEAPSFVGARVRGDDRFGIGSYLPRDGRPALVWTAAGALEWAWRTPAGVEHRPVQDEEIAAEDLEPAAVALRDALSIHVERTERTRADYLAVTDLVRRLDAALGEG